MYSSKSLADSLFKSSQVISYNSFFLRNGFSLCKNSKKYFINLGLKYPGKLYKRFVLHYVGRTIVVCVKQISGWETDLLKQEEITHMILFGEVKHKKDEDMITFNRYWERGISK